MLTLPARIDLISVPVRAIPASNVSSIENSWRAFRLRATVESSDEGMEVASSLAVRPCRIAHERRSYADRRSSCLPTHRVSD